MGNRRKSREFIMQALFSIDISGDYSEENLDFICKSFFDKEKLLPFFFEIIEGVIKNKEQIDKIIERFSSKWKISRMFAVDRNIMRSAVYEVLYRPDIPPTVSINEAIEISKKFGTEESGPFINGILDSVRIYLAEKGDDL